MEFFVVENLEVLFIIKMTNLDKSFFYNFFILSLHIFSFTFLKH